MTQNNYNSNSWKKKKVEVEKVVKNLERKREKTLYLYEVEKQSRRKTQMLQLQALLEYESKELQKAQKEFQALSFKIALQEKEDQKYNTVKMIGIVVLIIFSISILSINFGFSNKKLDQVDQTNHASVDVDSSSMAFFAPLKWLTTLPQRGFVLLEKYSKQNGNAFTGAAIVTQPTMEQIKQGVNENCPISTICLNETIISCINQTVQKCEPHCINETKQVCKEDCTPQCHSEIVNGKDRQVCVSSCSTICSNEIFPSCDTKTCTETVEQKCSSKIIQHCDTKTFCKNTGEYNQTTDLVNINSSMVDNITSQVSTVNTSTLETNKTLNVSAEINPSDLYPLADLNIVINGRFEDTTIYPSILGWRTGGNTKWFMQSFTVFEGTYATGFNTISDNQLTWFNTTVNITQPATLTFYWKVSSESGFDFLLFCNSTVSCTRTTGYIDRISGTVDWTKQSYTLPVGTQVLHWAYAKDGSALAGSDQGWLDNVSIVNNCPPSGSSNGNFETGDLSNWNTGGGANWFVQNTIRQEGCFAGRGGTIDSNNITWINTTVTLAHPANLSFSWKVDSESGFDFLSFCNSTVSCTRTSGYLAQISGSQDWATKTYTLPVGTQVLHWAYAKDPSVNFSSDTGWLDNVTILNNHPVIINWSLNTTDLSTNSTNTNLTTSINASDSEGDAVKFIYNWFVNGTPIAVLNMPFEEFNGSLGNNTKDYSGLGNNGSENGALFWNATGGHDGGGAYMFNESGDFINIKTIAVNASRNGLTITAWIKPATLDLIRHVVVKEGSYRAGVNGNNLHFNFWNNTNDFSSITSSGSLLQTGWNFVSYVVLPNSTVQLYLNGSIIQTGQIIGSMNVSIDPVTISMSTSSFWNGTIDDVIIFNRSLSDEQIKALWLNRTDIIVAAETVIGDTWNVQVTPSDGTGDGNITTTNTVTIKNVLPTISTYFINTTNISSNRTEVNLTAYAVTSDADGDSVKVIYNWLVNATAIAVLNMPFEKINGTAFNNSWDYSGFGNHGNESGGIAWNATAGYERKGAYMFDSIDDYINLGDKDYFKTVCDGGCTFRAWINWKGNAASGASATSTILGRFDTENDDRFFWLEITNTSAGALHFYIFQNGSSTTECSTGLVIPINSWFQMVGRYNGSSVALFINGTQQASSSCSFSAINSSTWQDSEPTFIGARSSNGIPIQFFNGTIDEVMIFNRSLSAEQIFALWLNNNTVITASETVRGQNWSVQEIPNDGYEDGLMVTATGVNILNSIPVLSPLILNSTNLVKNDSTVNLTAYANTSDGDLDSIKVIYNWFRNNKSMTILNMPFEKFNGSTGNNTKDYSGYGLNGSEYGSIVWNASGGFDGRGAYIFDGSNDFILTQNESLFDFKNFTYVAWVKEESAAAGYHTIIDANDDIQLLAAAGSTYQIYGRCGSIPIGTVKPGVWTMISWVVNGSTYYVYENATLIGSGTGCSAGIDVSTLSIGAGFTGSSGNEFYPGVIDDVKIFNTSLSAEQIYMLYLNRSDQIDKDLLIVGDNWSVQGTPNDGRDDGVTTTSNILAIRDATAPVITIYQPANNSVNQSGNIYLNFSVTDSSGLSICWYAVDNGTNTTIPNCANLYIFPGKGAHNISLYANDTYTNIASAVAGNITRGAIPNITALVLNSTNLASNDTTVNLTAYATTTDNDNDPLKVIYNWYINNTIFTILNLPFEGINGTDNANTRDYTGLNVVVEHGGILWNRTAGFDGKGTYKFDGTDDYLSINNNTLFDFTNFTFVAWVKADSTSAGFHTILDVDDDKQLLGRNGAFYSLFGRCGSISVSSVKQGVWTQLAWVVNGSTFFLYENATLISNGTGCSGGIDGSSLNIGSGSGGNEYWDGYIDDIKVYNISLPAEQIAALYLNRSDIITSALTADGQNWTVQATPNDGYDDGITLVSNNITIRTTTATTNTAPPIPLLMSPNGTTTTSRTPTFIWNNSVDPDGDPNVSYRLEVDDNRAFTNTEVNVSGILNSTATNTSYTITTELSVDTTYFWRVFAYDQTVYSENSSVYNFTVQSYLAINVTSSTVAFGSLNNGANVSTPNNATPFRAENVGNIITNITVTGTKFFNAVTFPSSFYQFKIRANESGSFNVSNSTTNWVQMNTTSGIFHVVSLDWHSVSNDFITDLNISVPGNESAGSKSSTVTFTMTG